MMGLMRTARNMRLSPDPTHRCETCGAEWLRDSEGAWTLLCAGDGGDVDVQIRNTVMLCCGKAVIEMRPRTIWQRLPEALLIASLPVMVMGSMVFLLKLLEWIFG